MRVAVVAPLFESVPPKFYGGTERVISYLTEELVRQGHHVTLFASGDSKTAARLLPQTQRSLRLDASCVDTLAPHFSMLENVLRRQAEFDVVHFHVDYLHFPFSRRLTKPHLTTLHGRLDIPELLGLYQEYPEMPVVSISDSQRRPLPWLNWLGTVHNGIPANLYQLGKGDEAYLAFLGRVSPEKGLEAAIEIAKRTNLPLRIAAKVDKADQEYYATRIRPLLKQANIQFLGEIGDSEKQSFLANARALLFPVNWPEPFGMVMIEALACGTPVVAFKNGSVPEILEDAKTAFLVDSVDEAVHAVRALEKLKRERCRREFERRFSSERMAKNYVKLYLKLKELDLEHRHKEKERSHSVLRFESQPAL